MAKKPKSWHQAMAAIGSAKTNDQWLKAMASIPTCEVGIRKDALVHKYAGWPAKALCGAAHAVTSIYSADVTCKDCLGFNPDRAERE